MIAEQAAEYQTISSIPATRSKRMGVDSEAMGHIMSLLANAYSDPKLAVLREYSTNAWDAHVEAGVTKPIEVTLPNAMSRHLKIRDFGIGLTADDLCDIYSMYGASTKRGTNEQNGMLGIGCKSGLAYAQQFTIVSTKDHTRTTALVQRTDDGAGEMVIVETIPSTEPDGTEVVIPTPDAGATSEFERRANSFFRFWEEGTVLVNGKQPERVDGLWVTDNLCIVHGEREDKIVMGNVAYPYSREQLQHELPWSYSLVAFVPIGSVSFAPSREALRDNKKTQATMADVLKQFKSALVGRVQDEIDAAPNPAEALRTKLQWEPKVPQWAHSADYTYKGKPIPKEFDRKGKLLVQTSADSWRLGTHERDRPMPTSSYPRVMWVENYDRDSFTAGQKKKLNHFVEVARKRYADQHHQGNVYAARDDDAYPYKGIKMYALYAGKLDDPYIPQDRIIDWAKIEEIKLPRTVGQRQGYTGRIPGSYDIWEGQNVKYGVPGDDIDQTKPIFWAQESGAYGGAHARALEMLTGNTDFTLVCLSANRIDKFKRLFPKAVHFTDFGKTEHAKWEKTLTAEVKEAFKLHDSGEGDTYKTLDAAKVKDPELKRWIKLAKLDIAKHLAKRDTFTRYGVAAVPPRYTRSLDDHPLMRYPFIQEVDWTYGTDKVLKEQHVYVYINAVYAANRKEQK